MTPTEFVPLVVVLTLFVTGAFLWWARPNAATDGDVACDEDLHVLFDELTRAAEDEGVFDDDAMLDPRLANAADITPMTHEARDDLDTLVAKATHVQRLPMPVANHI